MATGRLSVHRHHRFVAGEVADRDGFVAVRAEAAGVDAPAEQVAVWAAAFVEVADLAVGAFVDGAQPGSVRWPAHRAPSRAMTPAPARAWDSRTDSPLVWQT